MYEHASGALVVYRPIGKYRPKIDPWNAIAHSGELKPMMFTAVYSEMPNVMSDFANLSPSL